jgi:hypothetical protein
MGIRVFCPNGHKLNVKSFLAGKRGVCPHCGAKFDIPAAKTDTAKAEAATDAARGDASDEQVHSVGHVASRGGSATATAPSAGSAEKQASHLVKGAGTARRGIPAAAPAVGVPTAPVAPVTPAGQGLPSAAPVTPAALATVQVSAVQPGAGQVGALPVGAVQPVAAQPLGALGAIPGFAPALGGPTALVRPAIADPLAEAPEASWYVRPPSGGQYGPAKPHTMREWMAQGRITADSLVWREGWPDWKLAGATFPSLGGPAAAGPPGAAALTGAIGVSSAAADDPFAVLGPANSSGSLPTSSLSTPSLGTSRRSVGSRRGDSTRRVMAIAGLCLALVVLSALLVYVLHLR